MSSPKARHVGDAVRAGSCPPPMYAFGAATSWRWSSRQFLAPQSPPAIGASGGEPEGETARPGLSTIHQKEAA